MNKENISYYLQMYQMADSIMGLIKCEFQCLIYPKCTYPETDELGPWKDITVVSSIDWPIQTPEEEIAQKITKWPQNWFKKLRPHVVSDPFNGDTLHIREEISICEDIFLIKQRKFGYYGWMTLWIRG